MTKIVRDSAYHDKGVAYQCLLIEMIDEALRHAKIDDPKTRRAIVSNIVFGLGNFHDQCWMKVQSQKFYPLVCFTPKFLNVNTNIDALEVVLAPESSFAFHEYAFGCIDAFYRGDPASKTDVGPFDGDSPEPSIS